MRTRGQPLQPNFAPSALSPEKQHALALARAAIQTIEQVVSQPRSQKRERSAMSAHKTLSKQSGVLMIGIPPIGDVYDTERIASSASTFKEQMERRYPVEKNHR